MGPSRKADNRPKKRSLVRWDEDLDELLLLTVQSVCNSQAIKIPWADVARTMGHNASEGAIVQHLAKVRARRVAAGKPVPPPLRRSVAVSSSAHAMSHFSGDATSKIRQASLKNKQPLQRGKENLDTAVKEDDARNGKNGWDTPSAYDDGHGRRNCPRISKTRAGARSKSGPTLTDTDIKSEPATVEDNIAGDEDISDKLLEYPSRNSSLPQPKKDSKVVILKYKPQRHNVTNKSHANTTMPLGVSDNNPPYNGLFPSLPGPNGFGSNIIINGATPIPIVNEMGMTQDGYYGISTTPDNSQAESADINATSLDFVPLQSLLGGPNPNQQNLIYPNHPVELFGQDMLGIGDTWMGDDSLNSLDSHEEI